MKKIVLILAFGIFSAMIAPNYSTAQAPAATNAQAAPIIIKPTMPIDYLMFASNALSTIEIQGSEVDVFLLCKNTLDSEIKKQIADKKRPDEQITFGIQLEVAQNIITLLNRAKLTGVDAPKFKGFINSLMDAGKNYKPENK